MLGFNINYIVMILIENSFPTIIVGFFDSNGKIELIEILILDRRK